MCALKGEERERRGERERREGKRRGRGEGRGEGRREGKKRVSENSTAVHKTNYMQVKLAYTGNISGVPVICI